MEITPNGLQKELTTLLSELVFDTGFKKKKIGWLTRKVGECEQFFTITFTRDRGLPGNLYSVNFTLSFTYKEVDRLTSLFLGMEYEKEVRPQIFYCRTGISIASILYNGDLFVCPNVPRIKS